MKERLKLDVAYAQQPFPGKNEDRILVRDALGLYVVIDGFDPTASGDGERAAERVLSSIDYYASKADESLAVDISSAFEHARTRLSGENKEEDYQNESRLNSKAGAVVTCAQIERSSQKLHYAQLGSTMLKVFREGDLYFSTKSEIFPWGSPSGVTNCISSIPTDRIDLEQQGVVDIEPHDRVIIYSDGITGGEMNDITYTQMWEIAKSAKTAKECSIQLVDMCYQTHDYTLERIDTRHVPDDKTVIVIDVE